MVFRVEKEGESEQMMANARSLSSSVRPRLEMVLAARMRALIRGSRGSNSERVLQKTSSIRLFFVHLCPRSVLTICPSTPLQLLRIGLS